MAKYKLVVKRSVAKDFRPIPKKDVVRILRKIEGLRENPRPAVAVKLSGGEKYRIQQGVYRILYTVEDEIVTITIVKIGHRRDVYRV